jgi:hypothetical protein
MPPRRSWPCHSSLDSTESRCSPNEQPQRTKPGGSDLSVASAVPALEPATGFGPAWGRSQNGCLPVEPHRLVVLVVRVGGFEPPSLGSEPIILPLNYTRAAVHTGIEPVSPDRQSGCNSSRIMDQAGTSEATPTSRQHMSRVEAGLRFQLALPLSPESDRLRSLAEGRGVEPPRQLRSLRFQRSALASGLVLPKNSFGRKESDPHQTLQRRPARATGPPSNAFEQEGGIEPLELGWRPSARPSGVFLRA